VDRRSWLVVGVTLGVALVGGSAAGIAAARHREAPSTLQPLAAEPSSAPPTTVLATTASPTTPPPTTAPPMTPPPTTPPPTTPPPTTVPPTTRPPSPTPRHDVAYVRIDNTFSGTVVVGVHGTHARKFTLQAGQHLDLEVLPEPNGNDTISVGSADHPTCGMGDAGRYFTVGKRYRLVIYEQKDSCQVEGGPVGAPFFRVDPA
jgi:hypothetical protein